MFNFTWNSEPQPKSEDSQIDRLVQATLQGQTDAFDELVFLCRDQVYATAWNLTHNQEDALDVTQEAFIRAYNALKSYKGRSSFNTWLHRIVLNTGIDYLRKVKRHRHESLDNHDQTDDAYKSRRLDPTVPANQREQVYSDELRRLVYAALDQISARQRQVFVLRYYHELEIREIADVLKCSQGSVKRHLFRAQQRLKELLKDMRPPDDGK